MADQKPADYLPKKPGNNEAIVAMVEKDKGPVGPGHHNSHRTAAIMSWLEKQEKKSRGK